MEGLNTQLFFPFPEVDRYDYGAFYFEKNQSNSYLLSLGEGEFNPLEMLPIWHQINQAYDFNEVLTSFGFEI